MTGRLLSFALSVCAVAMPATAQTGPQRCPARDVLDRVSSWSRPEYPKDALEAGTTGDVDVNFTLSESGELVSAEAIDGPDALRFAALEALHGWTFRAAEGDEARGDVWTTLTFEFADEDGMYFATLQRSPSTLGRHILPSPAVPPAGVRRDAAAPSRPASGSPAVGAAPGLVPPMPPIAGTPPPVATAAKKAKILNRPRPNYTEQARANHTEGNVVVKVLLGADRTIKAASIVRGIPDGLDTKALEAARSLEFEPATNGEGAPIDAWVTVSVNFVIR